MKVNKVSILKKHKDINKSKYCKASREQPLKEFGENYFMYRTGWRKKNEGK